MTRRLRWRCCWLLSAPALLGCRTAPPEARFGEESLGREVARHAGVVAKGKGAFTAYVAEGAGILIDNPGGTVRLIGVAEGALALNSGEPDPCMPGVVEHGVGAPLPNVAVSLSRFGFGADARTARDHLETALLETPRFNDQGWWVLSAALPATLRITHLIEHEQRVLAGDEVLPRVNMELRVPPRVAVTVKRALRIEAQGLGAQSVRREAHDAALRTEAPLSLNAAYGISLRDCRATIIEARTALGALEGVNVAAPLRCAGAQEVRWKNGSGRKEIHGVSGAVLIEGGGGSVDVDAGGSLDVRTTLAPVAWSQSAGDPRRVAFLQGEQPAASGDGDPENAVRDHRDLASRLISRHGAVLLALPPESPVTLDAFSHESDVLINLRAESIWEGGIDDDAHGQSRVLVMLGQGPERASCIVEARREVTVTAYDGVAINGAAPRRSRE